MQLFSEEKLSKIIKEGKIVSISELKKTNDKIAEGVVSGYKKIEEGVVGGYKKIENSVVDGYKKIEDAFVDKFLTHDGETVEEAKERLSSQRK